MQGMGKKKETEIFCDAMGHSLLWGQQFWIASKNILSVSIGQMHKARQSPSSYLRVRPAGIPFILWRFLGKRHVSHKTCCGHQPEGQQTHATSVTLEDGLVRVPFKSLEHQDVCL